MIEIGPGASGAPQIVEIYVLWLYVPPFPFLSFLHSLFFLSSPTAKTARRILSQINTSNDACSATDVPLGWENTNFIFYLIYSKKSKQRRLEKFFEIL